LPHEIERKFLVRRELWSPTGPGTPFRQAYIGTNPGRTVRVRVEGDQGRLTLKGPTQGLTRAEFEYSIPLADAEALLATLCDSPVVEKIRYHIPIGAHVWEVDVFQGANAGLVVAEIELDAEDEAFDKPAWVGEEVSFDPRYANTRLAQKPFTTWET